MITEQMITQWREENANGNGIGAGDDSGRVLEAAEAVRRIQSEYPAMEVVATEELDGARVLCRDGDSYVLFMDANGMWGQDVTRCVLGGQ